MSKKYAFSLGIFIILYVGLSFSIPPDPTTLERFDLSVLQLRLLSLTVALPLMVIWFLAFYGFAKFKEYALRIIDSSDGQAFNTLANGLMVLAFTLPISSLTSLALKYFAHIYPDFTAATVIANRYIALCLAIAAFVLIYQGSKRLADLITKKITRPHYLWAWITALFMGGLYAYFIITYIVRGVSDPSDQTVYYLPAWLIITTIVIPYTCIWYLGLKSATHILFYKRNVQGLVYRQTLGSLAAGVGMVVSASIVMQLLTALSSHFVTWGLQSLLILVFLLIATMAIGYAFIAFGAKKLKKIEEV